MPAALAPPAVALHDVVKRFGTHSAIEGVSFDVAPGSFVSIVGPSGCGKSTLLNILAGLDSPSSGSVDVFGRSLDGINRHATYMFQQDALLPWKTVLANVQFGLTIRGGPNAETEAVARRWLERVGLKDRGDLYPHQLSGGMRKRVALAQTWIVNPDLVLMDEPFTALDVHTRWRMESEILNLWTGSGKTVVFVTHDLEEAIALSDDVLVLSSGPGSHLMGRYAIDLERPRRLIDIRTEARFHELYAAIWNDLRGEVLKSHDRNS